MLKSLIIRASVALLPNLKAYGNSSELVFFAEVTESLSSIALFDNHFLITSRFYFPRPNIGGEMAMMTILNS